MDAVVFPYTNNKKTKNKTLAKTSSQF